MGRRAQGRRKSDHQPVTDVVVIGGGIAGVTAAAHLAPHTSVTLLEAEATLAYHTTGRSAALFIVNYGQQGFRPLTKASETFLIDPPEGSADGDLLSERGLLWLGREDQMGRLEDIAREGVESGASSQLVDIEEVVELVPVVRSDVITGGLFEPTAQDIDVAALHQAFVRITRQNGGEIRTNQRVRAVDRLVSGWRLTTESDSYECDVIVNASGAWGDVVAELAGIPPVGLVPKRRTAFMVPGSEDYARWPMAVDTDQDFYFKADGVQLLCSLAEENPSPPEDPRPAMEDIALAIERINHATTLNIRTVNSEWTGLRTFAPDLGLVVGEEPTAPGFFWLVGQGGTGIQASPGYGSLLAALVLGSDLPDELVDAGVDPAVTDPARFRN